MLISEVSRVVFVAPALTLKLETVVPTDARSAKPGRVSVYKPYRAAHAWAGTERRVPGPAPALAWLDVSRPFRLRDPDLTPTSCGRGQDHYGSTPEGKVRKRRSNLLSQQKQVGVLSGPITEESACNSEPVPPSV